VRRRRLLDGELHPTVLLTVDGRDVRLHQRGRGRREGARARERAHGEDRERGGSRVPELTDHARSPPRHPETEPEAAGAVNTAGARRPACRKASPPAGSTEPWSRSRPPGSGGSSAPRSSGSGNVPAAAGPRRGQGETFPVHAAQQSPHTTIFVPALVIGEPGCSRSLHRITSADRARGGRARRRARP
jgi:hypothetical protein